MTRGDISLAGSANYVTAYDDWVSGNADPGIFAEKYGFDIGTVYSGDLRDDEGLAGISTPDIQRRGELARTYMDDHDARRVGHDLGREIGDIVTEVEEEPEEIVGFSSMTDLEKRGILTGTEIRNIQATIRGDLDFDTSKVVTDPNFGGLLDRTFNSEFPESGVLGSRGSYVGDRFHVTWDTDLFGIGKSTVNKVLFQTNPDITGLSGLDAHGVMKDPDVEDAFLGGGVLAEPFGGDPTVGQGGFQDLGGSLARFSQSGRMSFNQMREMLPQMSSTDLEAMQREMWRMGYYGESAIRNGDVPHFGVTSPLTEQAFYRFVLDVFTSESRDAVKVRNDKRADFRHVFQETKDAALGVFAAGPETVDRAGIVAEFGTLSEDKLDVSINDISKAVVGERLTKSETNAIKKIIRGQENERIDTVFNARSGQASELFERQKRNAARAVFGTSSGANKHYDEMGNLITPTVNPSAGFNADLSSGGTFVEPVQDFDPNAPPPLPAGMEGFDPESLEESLIQADRKIVTEDIDPTAVARLHMRKTRGAQVFGRALAGSANALSSLVREGV